MIDVSGEDKNPVAAVANWRTRIRSEHESAKNWQKEWGFLLTDHRKEPDAYTAPGVTSGPGNLRSTMAASLLRSENTTQQMGKKKDSMDIFMDNFMRQHTTRWRLGCKEILLEN